MDVKISVVVPIYNMEKFILHAVTCLKEQDMEDVEFLLINDGSTDRTMEILTELVEGDSRFRILSIENHGYGYACNYGMKHARGVYTAIYEPDDSIDSDFYSTLYEYAERYPHADVIRYNGFYKNINGVKSRLYMWEEKYTDQILDKYQMKRFWRSHPSVYNGMYRTEFLRTKNVVFCESPGASFQDVTFMISLFYSNPSIYIINKLKYYYTIHDKQSINNIYSKIDNIIMNWNSEYNWIKEKGINDKSFFTYKICMQAYSILKKIKDRNIKNKIYKAVNIFFCDGLVDCGVATLKQKCICRLLFIKTFIR
ncbi:glycosyltransferase family 2 protein [Mailhella massiliensis]|uniref:glycosyltransferase family 2 protein n=1 Tax=Mailhella massiliensis TaxID=1903261 RepID=UPI00097DF099|nr:glycosyltransferase family 2 protein [Mailhella massiliensis]